MGYDQYTVPDVEAVKPTFLVFSFRTHKHTSMAFRVILSNLFEEQLTQNHQQYLPRLLRECYATQSLLPFRWNLFGSTFNLNFVFFSI